jgi:hypothetical protein
MHTNAVIKRTLIAIVIALTLTADELPKEPAKSVTIEQLEKQLADARKEIEVLKAAAAWDQKSITGLGAAYNACLGQRPQLPPETKQ